MKDKYVVVAKTNLLNCDNSKFLFENMLKGKLNKPQFETIE